MKKLGKWCQRSVAQKTMEQTTITPVIISSRLNDPSSRSLLRTNSREAPSALSGFSTH